MHRLFLLCFVVGCGSHPSNSTSDASSGTPDGASAADAPTPSTYPRLVVAGSAGIQIWDHADAIAAARAPDATLAGVTGALGLAVGDDTLYVTASGSPALYRFTHAAGLADATPPAGSIDAASLGAQLDYHAPLVYDSGNLWLLAGGAIHLVANAQTASSATAHFVHPWSQIESMVLDSGRLIGGQISGAGMLVWNNAASRTGQVAADWTLAPYAAFHSVIAGGRLYASAYSPPNIAMWSHIAADASPVAADGSLGSVCGTGTGAELRFMTVNASDQLIVLHNELVAGGTAMSERVCVFQNASMLTGTPTPDAMIADPELQPSAATIDKAVLVGERLFVMDRAGITIYDNATTSPVRVAKLPIAGPEDFVVLQ